MRKGAKRRGCACWSDIRAEWQDLDRRIEEFDAEFVRWAKERRRRRLVTIPGVGVTISTALIAAAGKAETFDMVAILRHGWAWFRVSRRRRQAPTSWGSASEETSILRKLLIHGARAALPYVAEKDTALGRWAKSLLSRVHQNVAVVAFANKLARTCWTVLRSGQSLPPRERLGGSIIGLDGAHEALTS